MLGSAPSFLAINGRDHWPANPRQPIHRTTRREASSVSQAMTSGIEKPAGRVNVPVGSGKSDRGRVSPDGTMMPVAETAGIAGYFAIDAPLLVVFSCQNDPLRATGRVLVSIRST